MPPLYTSTRHRSAWFPLLRTSSFFLHFPVPRGNTHRNSSVLRCFLSLLFFSTPPPRLSPGHIAFRLRDIDSPLLNSIRHDTLLFLEAFRHRDRFPRARCRRLFESRVSPYNATRRHSYARGARRGGDFPFFPNGGNTVALATQAQIAIRFGELDPSLELTCPRGDSVVYPHSNSLLALRHYNARPSRCSGRCLSRNTRSHIRRGEMVERARRK